MIKKRTSLCVVNGAIVSSAERKEARPPVQNSNDF